MRFLRDRPRQYRRANTKAFARILRGMARRRRACCNSIDEQRRRHAFVKVVWLNAVLWSQHRDLPRAHRKAALLQIPSIFSK
jgi:hypothetical protein